MTFPYQAVFESSIGRSVWIHEVAPRVIQFDKELNLRSVESPPGEGVRADKTMFREIRLVPPSQVWGPEVRAFMASGGHRVRVSELEFFNKLFEVFQGVVEATWQPGVSHVVLHSSGYDSRLLSYAIRRLYEKNGSDWLGDVLFLELEGEVGAVREILRLEGWPESALVVYNEGAPARHLHVRSCEFEHAYLRTNAGMYTRGFNFWWEPVEWLVEEGLISSRWQGYTGYYANDVLEGVNRFGVSLASVFEGFGYDVYAFAPMKGQWVLPYLALDFLQILVKFGEGQRPHYQKHLLEYLSPGLAKVPRMMPDYNLRELADGLLAQMGEEYQASWYGRWEHPEARPCRYTVHDEWWGHWGLASYCEYARSRGHKIISSSGQPGPRMKELRDRPATIYDGRPKVRHKRRGSHSGNRLRA